MTDVAAARQGPPRLISLSSRDPLAATDFVVKNHAVEQIRP